MTGTILASTLQHFNRNQLEAIKEILRLLDPEEFRDYHDQFGVCNAPDMIDALRKEIQSVLNRT